MKNNIVIKIGVITGLFLCVQNVGFAQSEEKTVEKKVIQYQLYQSVISEEVLKPEPQSKITDEQMPEILTKGEVKAKACPLLYAVDEKGNVMWGKNVDKKTRKKLLKNEGLTKKRTKSKKNEK